MAEKIPAVRLRTNIPEILTLSAVYYSAGKDWKDPETGKVKKLPPTLALVGEQAGTKIKIYVPLDCGKTLTEHGWLTKTGQKDKYGGPAFQVNGHPRIQVLKVEDGKHKTTTVSPADEAGVPEGTRSVIGDKESGHASPSQKAPEKAPKPSGAPTFQTLEDRLMAALNAVCAAYKKAGLVAPNPDQLQAHASTLFIEASRQEINP